MSHIYKDFNNNKKGQITLFILIGLVLLALVLFGLFFMRQVQESQTDLGEPNEVPVEFVPVEQYVEQCLFDISKVAFIELGENGGYINPQNYFNKKYYPTESEVLEFSPGSSIWIPYWWYLKSPSNCYDDCMFESNRPVIDGISQGGDSSSSPLMDHSVEGMVSEYIEQNLDTCLNEFIGLKEYVISAEGEKEVITTITEQDVIIDLLYLLEVEGSESKGEIDRFRTHVPLNFRKIYQMALNITQAQQEINFLDYNLLNLISSFSGIDDKLLPPMSGTSFEMGASTYWFEPEVKEKIEEMLMSYVPMYQVMGTGNYNPNIGLGEEPLVKSIIANLALPLQGDPQPSLDVKFTYLSWWPIYLHITPNEGGSLSSRGLFNSHFTFLGIQRYNFVYDLAYPVMVEIKDDEAFYGEGYSFRFALESNLQNNAVINTSQVPLEMVSDGSSMRCNFNQRNTNNITIQVLDGENGAPVDDTFISFILGSETCFIGMTGVNGTYVGKFPVGLGNLKIQKNDYVDSSINYFTTMDMEDSLELIIEPYRYKNVTVIKKTMSKINGRWVYEGDLKQLDDNEEVIILFESLEDSDSAPIIPINLNGPEKTTIKIIPGEYKINGQIILKEDLLIPEDERCALDVLVCLDHYTIPEIPLEQSISGGIIFNNESGNSLWEVNKESLDSSDEIIFYLLSFSLKDVPSDQRKVEDLELMGQVEELTQDYRAYLEPAFI